MLRDIAHTDIDPARVRADARTELLSGQPLPALVEHMRKAQAEHLRGHGSFMRGLSDEAKEFFARAALLGLPAGVTLADVAGECRITPEHRRMFPELPDKDLLLAGVVDGELVFEFENEESVSR